MKKAWKGTAAAAVAATVTGLCGWGTALPAQAATTEMLKVDFAATTGNFRGGSSGTLYGLGDEGAPTPALVNGAHITNTSQKAPFGTQHPSGDAIKVEGDFFAKHGDDMYIYMQDYYPDWAYNGGRRPGDDRTYDLKTGTYTNVPNGKWDYLEVVEFVTEAVIAQSKQPTDYVLIPFNEPDGGNWYPNWGAQKDQFLADWQAAYDKIEEVYARHGLGHVRIGGPGDSAWHTDRSADLLDYAKAHGSLPDVFIWHELGIDNLANFRTNLATYRQLEKDRGTDPIPINITEFGMLRDMGVPGQLIQWFSMFEDAKVDAQSAYWNYAGNLNDNSARPNGANGGWWFYKWYGDLEGSKTVKVTPPELNAVDTLQGIGAVDTVNKRATVLYGGTGSDVSLDLSGLDTSVFGDTVDVEVREDLLTGAEGLAATPRVVKALSGVSLNSGKLAFDVPTYDRYAAYQVIVTPHQQRNVVTAQAAQPWSASTEAEKTTLAGAQVFTQDPKAGGGWKFLASGGKDVGGFNSAASKADWSVQVPADGTYRYQVIGATPGTPGRHALFVDGKFAADVQYSADLALNGTSRWQYRGSAEVEIPLTAGAHTLSLRASKDGTTRLPNSDITLDKFNLTDVTAGETTAYPASTFRLYGGATLQGGDPQTSGTAKIGDGQRADLYATAFTTGYYEVALGYRTTGASSVELSVNGRKVTTLTAPGAGSWTSTARLHLVEGINEIEISSPQGALIEQLTTTRAKAADTAQVSIEAENATLRGTSVASNAGTGSNASNGKAVGFVGNGAGNYLEIARGAGFDAPGDYDVSVTYANAELVGNHAYNPQVVDRRIDVSEGTSQVGHAYFRYTYSWDSYQQRTIPVTLTSADQAIRLGNATAYAPNIDKVTIAPTAVGTPTTVRSSAAVSAKVTSDAEPNEAGWYTKPVTVALTGEDGVAVQYQVNDGAWTTYTSTPLSFTADGTSTIDYRALGDDGQPFLGSEKTLQVKLDQAAPVTAPQVSPASGTVPAGQTISATFTGTDDTSGLDHTEYQVNGGDWKKVGADPVSFTESGTYTVGYRSVDVAGNVEATKQVVLTVTARPTAKVSITSADAPSADGWYQQSVVVALTPPQAGQKVQYRLNAGAWKNYTGSISVTGNGLTSIDHRLLSANVVVAGSEAETLVKIDKTAPAAAATRTPNLTAGTPRNPLGFTFDAIDTYSGVDTVEYKVNNGPWTKAGTDPIVISQVGDYVISYRATDKAGNAGAAKSLTATIKADPATTLKASASTVKPGAAVTLTLTGFTRWDDVALTYGAASQTVVTDSAGSAKITVKLAADTVTGPLKISATGSNGQPSATTTVTVKK